jgi:hypothetical protein
MIAGQGIKGRRAVELKHHLGVQPAPQAERRIDAHVKVGKVGGLLDPMIGIQETNAFGHRLERRVHPRDDWTGGEREARAGQALSHFCLAEIGDGQALWGSAKPSRSNSFNIF